MRLFSLGAASVLLGLPWFSISLTVCNRSWKFWQYQPFLSFLGAETLIPLWWHSLITSFLEFLPGNDGLHHANIAAPHQSALSASSFPNIPHRYYQHPYQAIFGPKGLYDQLTFLQSESVRYETFILRANSRHQFINHWVQTQPLLHLWKLLAWRQNKYGWYKQLRQYCVHNFHLLDEFCL